MNTKTTKTYKIGLSLNSKYETKGPNYARPKYKHIFIPMK